MSAASVIVAGGFSSLQGPTIRFLEEAGRWGRVHVVLWEEPAPDGPAKYTAAERRYVLENIRYVSSVSIGEEPGFPPAGIPEPRIWAVAGQDDTPERRSFCAAHGIQYRVIPAEALRDYPAIPPPPPSARKKVIVTGCFDWFHSGHVRFFEEASAYGELYVVVGSDANLRLLKGDGHPMFSQEERRYVVQSVRFVAQALISTGAGWMDAEPEVERVRPDIYLVNEDGDQPEKREFCKRHGLEYVILKREPKPGLPRRQSTDLRGF